MNIQILYAIPRGRSENFNEISRLLKATIEESNAQKIFLQFSEDRVSRALLGSLEQKHFAKIAPAPIADDALRGGKDETTVVIKKIESDAVQKGCDAILLLGGSEHVAVFVTVVMLENLGKAPRDVIPVLPQQMVEWNTKTGWKKTI